MRGGIGGSRIVRDGATVRRPAGPWTPAVHALLNHLQNVGFEHVPHVIGLDGEFETVTFIAGDTPAKGSERWIDDGVLTSVGSLLRRYHDAASTFTPPPWAQWQHTSIPTSGSLVCHNDLCLGNVVFRNHAAIGIIDFDFAHPADPLWDLAMAAWHWTPLLTGSGREQFPESERPARLRVLLDAYGIRAARRAEVLRIIVALGRRMRQKRATDPPAAAQFDVALQNFALHRQRWLKALQ